MLDQKTTDTAQLTGTDAGLDPVVTQPPAPVTSTPVDGTPGDPQPVSDIPDSGPLTQEQADVLRGDVTTLTENAQDAQDAADNSMRLFIESKASFDALNFELYWETYNAAVACSDPTGKPQDIVDRATAIASITHGALK
jgi:hypothetical protein